MPFLRTWLCVGVEAKSSSSENCKRGGVKITRKNSHEGWECGPRGLGWAAWQKLTHLPPLRSHTMLIVASIICFIPSTLCVWVGKKLLRGAQKKCFVMLWTFPSSPAFTFFTVSRWMQLIFPRIHETFHLRGNGSLSDPHQRYLVGCLPQPFSFFMLHRTPWEFKTFLCENLITQKISLSEISHNLLSHEKHFIKRFRISTPSVRWKG